MSTRNAIRLCITLILSLSHFESAAEQQVDVDAVVSNINTAVQRMEKYERAERDMLESNRSKVNRLNELNRLMEKTKMYTAERASLVTEAAELEASLNYLRPSLEDLGSKINQSREHLNTQWEKVAKIKQFASSPSLKKLSPSARQLYYQMEYVAPKRSSVDASFRNMNMYDRSRSIRLAPKAKYPDQADTTPRFVRIRKGAGADRIRFVAGERYDLQVRSGDSFRGTFMGFENDQLVFKALDSGNSLVGEEKVYLAVKAEDIMDFDGGRTHEFGLEEPAADGFDRSKTGRKLDRSDLEVKEAILGEGGIRELYADKATPKSKTPAEPTPTTPRSRVNPTARWEATESLLNMMIEAGGTR